MFAAREAMMVYMIKFMSFPMVFMVLASLLVLCYRLAPLERKDKYIYIITCVIIKGKVTNRIRKERCHAQCFIYLDVIKRTVKEKMFGWLCENIEGGRGFLRSGECLSMSLRLSSICKI